jgi:two-component sensor histidine kinase/CheY-like chemotaxis protein
MKLVMVDDSEADRRLFRILIEESLGSKLEFWGEGTAAKGLETCRAVAPDCILIDYKLPDMTGLDFIAQLRSAEAPELPPSAVVMLTGLANEQVAVSAMRAGAQDYLIKDRMTPEGLGSAVERATQKMMLIRELKQERDWLAESLAEKEVLLKEVHHRVKNNLQVIASLLRLQAGAFGDGALSIALRESQNRVESMAMIHEQLYQTGDLREVDLAEHASLLLNNLLHSYGVDDGRIAGHVTMVPLPLGVDRAIPAGLILNELVSNALKHAFPDGRRGSIWIEGTRHAGRIGFEVRDDGRGIARNSDGPPRKSLGLEIVNILTRQLKGNLVMESKSGAPLSGAAFRISFPEEEG